MTAPRPHPADPADAPTPSATDVPAAATAPRSQARNPLHGLTLEAILTALVAGYGWDGLGRQINIRCFTSDPSIASSLKFLRKTPWARDKVESLYLFMLRKDRAHPQAPRTACRSATPLAGGDTNGPA